MITVVAASGPVSAFAAVGPVDAVEASDAVRTLTQSPTAKEEALVETWEVMVVFEV
jgi:hypothetical protein